MVWPFQPHLTVHTPAKSLTALGRVLRTLLFLCLLLFNKTSFWAEDKASTDLEIWAPVTLQLPLGKKLYSTITVQPRFGNNITELERFIINSGLGYRINKHLSAEAGYEWNTLYVWSDKDLADFRWENRAWQGVLLNKKWDKFTLTSRHRIEERFIEQAGSPAFRSRHSIGFVYDLGQKRRWYLTGNEEILINLNNTGGVTQLKGGVNQNRLYVGIGRRIGQYLRIESGYMLQYVNGTAPNLDQFNHIIQARALINLDKGASKPPTSTTDDINSETIPLPHKSAPEP